MNCHREVLRLWGNMKETELLRALAALEKALGELIKKRSQEIAAADFERIDKLMKEEGKNLNANPAHALPE